MVLDTSALIAILVDEPERSVFIRAIEEAASCRVSTATFVETSIVLEARYGAEALRILDRFIAKAQIEILPVDLEQGHTACRAFSRFGKGRHRAGLNYGDCFAYALANVLAEPLLCKGADFTHTDVRLAIEA